MELHAVIREGLVIDSQHAVFGLGLNLSQFMRTVDIALQVLHLFLIIKDDDALQRFVLLTTRSQESGVTANLEMDIALVGILHVPDNVNFITFQLIGHSEVKAVGVYLQCLLTLVESVCHTVWSLGNELELGIACKTVTGKMILLAIYTIGIIIDAAYDGEQDRRAAWPFLASLPQVFTSVTIFDAL